MHIVGIDIAKKIHVACVMNRDGDVIAKSIKIPNTVEGFNNFIERLREISAEFTDFEFGMEATGHYWLNIYTHLIELGCNVHVVNPVQSDALRGLYNGWFWISTNTSAWTPPGSSVAENFSPGDWLLSEGTKYAKIPSYAVDEVARVAAVTAQSGVNTLNGYFTSGKANNAQVSQSLHWRNFGDGHIIIDNSSGEFGSGINHNINPDIPWNPSYPVLMGWNQYQTYGVRVDSAKTAEFSYSARVADSVRLVDWF